MKSFGATMMWAGRRFLSSLPALFCLLGFTFLLTGVRTSDPGCFFAYAPNAAREKCRIFPNKMGLNKPVPNQLLLYLYDVGRGNLGRHHRDKAAIGLVPACPIPSACG